MISEELFEMLMQRHKLKIFGHCTLEIESLIRAEYELLCHLSKIKFHLLVKQYEEIEKDFSPINMKLGGRYLDNKGMEWIVTEERKDYRYANAIFLINNTDGVVKCVGSKGRFKDGKLIRAID